MGNDHPFIRLHCSHCGKLLTVQLSCGDRTCSTCRAKWFGYHYKTVLDCVKGWPRAYFMTLTIQNYDGKMYRSDVTKLRKDFGRIRERFKNEVRGGFYVVQATNKSKGWHLHAHVLFDGSFIAEKALSRAWANITSGNYIVDIRMVQDPKIAVKYLLKDFLQSPKIRPEDHAEYNGVFAGSRIIQPFGTYKNVKFRVPYPCPICGRIEWVKIEVLLGVEKAFHKFYNDST